MIQWLIRSVEQNSDLAQGIAPPNMLHPVEQRRLSSLRVTKRRREWLLGRWTAKQLLQTCLAQERHVRLPLESIAIYNDAAGVPVALVQDQEWIISISHSHNVAFCATLPADARACGLGADIEHIESRAERFVEDYFTSAEIDRVRRAPETRRDTFITAIWSAKEAALKALQLGLTIDTRRVNCAIDPQQYHATDWLAFEITCERTYTERLHGWWRIWNDHVLTLAVRA
jgi:4'-phosphopantetheinyl transferase